MSPWAYLAAALAIAGLAGTASFRLGRLPLEVKVAQVEKTLADERTQHAQDTAKAAQKALAKQQALTRNAEKVTHDQETRIQVTADRAARAERSAGSLRSTIAALNARPVPSTPEAAAIAGEARSARELLDACSTRYTSLAAVADQLRDQVTGLQQFAEIEER